MLGFLPCILLIFKPVKGYWILASWHQLFVLGWTMAVHDRDWGALLGKCSAYSTCQGGSVSSWWLGLLMISTLVHPRVARGSQSKVDGAA